MAVVASRRSVMTLFSGADDVYSHQVRLVVAEKGINVEIVDVDPSNPPEDLIDLNPYNNVPTLVDRDLGLYNAQVIMEYLDERFPHPPLMPVDPVTRARNRLMLYRIGLDLYQPYQTISEGKDKAASKARKDLRDNLVMISPVFEHLPYFMSDEFSLVDCAVLPLLWRLPQLGVELPKQAQALGAYMERMFARDSFLASLTDPEKEIHL